MAGVLGRLTVVVVALASAQAAQARPLDLTLEARVGPYLPDTDPYRGANALDVSRGASAFACSFGLGVRPVVFVSPSITVFDLFGTLTLGGEVGFYSVRAKRLSNALDCSSHTAVTSDELTIVPLLATVTYRFDWALDRFSVPVVPYGRLGLGGAGYLITQDGKFPTGYLSSDGQRKDAVGFSLGGKVAVGMMVALDFLEPMRALRARAKNIYKHTFVFVEVAGFDAGMYENTLIDLLPRQSYIGKTLVVGSERLPLVTGGLSIAF
jgi:hypothetical protein